MSSKNSSEIFLFFRNCFEFLFLSDYDRIDTSKEKVVKNMGLFDSKREKQAKKAISALNSALKTKRCTCSYCGRQQNIRCLPNDTYTCSACGRKNRC